MNNLLNQIFDKNIYNDFDYSKYTAKSPNWNVDKNYFEKAISEVKELKLIIEVGSWEGNSAICLANILKEKKIDAKIICVDVFTGDAIHWTDEFKSLLKLKNGFPTIYQHFISNVIRAGFQNVIFPLPLTSWAAARLLKINNVSVDLVYIDSSHTFPEIYYDLISFFDLLNNDGVLIGDDYGNSFPDIRKYVDQFCNERGIDVEIEGVKYKIKK